MFIKCPRCAVGYSIPDSTVLDKPRKMRCLRCNTIFAVLRRSCAIPSGYKEFQGNPSALPSEFTFLTPVKTIEPKLVIEPEQTKPRFDETKLGYSQTDHTQASNDPEPKKDTFSPDNRQATPKTDAAPAKAIVEDIPLEPQPKTDNLIKEVFDDTKKEPTPSGAPGDTPKNTEGDGELTSVPLPEIPLQLTNENQGSAVPDIYSASAWETEVPLDLTHFAVSDTQAHGQIMGKVVTLLIVAFSLFLVFVAYRNAWSLSLSDIHNQVGFAFSGEEMEELPDAVEGLETTLEDRRLILRKNKRPLLVVTGKVFNNTLTTRTHIVLRGRLVDDRGKIRLQTRIPCNKLIKDTKIKRARKGSIKKYYRTKGKLHNCSIKGEQNGVYQLIFENLPRDFDETFNVKIKPFSARYPE